MEQQTIYPEISVADLFFYILSKWRKLLVAILVGALTFGIIFGALYLKQTKSTSKSDVDAILHKLTNEEKVSIQDSADLITNYKKMFEKQKEYNAKSIYQSIDSFQIQTVVMKYYIDNFYQVSYPVIEGNNNIIPLIQSYNALLSREELYEKVSLELDPSIEPLYFAELVDVDTSEQDEGILTVTIYSDSMDISESISGIIDDALNEQKDSMIEKYGDHNLLLMSNVKQVTVDRDVYEDQIENVKKMTDITKNIADIEKQYGGDQLVYLNYLTHEQNESSINIWIYIVLGAVLCAAIVAFYEFVKYLTSDSVKTINEFNNKYNIDVLETFVFEEKKNIIDKFLQRKRLKLTNSLDNDAKVNLIDARVSALVKEDKLSLIIPKPLEDNKYISNLIDSLSEKYTVSVMNDILTDPNDLAEFSNTDVAIFVKVLSKSNNSDFVKEIELANSSDVKILGNIMVG